jgi:hypothetical protein
MAPGVAEAAIPAGLHAGPAGTTLWMAYPGPPGEEATMHAIRIAAVAALMWMSNVALADKLELTNVDVDGMLAYHAELAEVLRTRDYKHISMRDRQEIDRAQSLIRSRLEGKSTMSELTEAGRLDVFNAHEHVVALVEEAEDDRLVCDRRKVAGSHTMQTVCDNASNVERSRRKLALEEVYRKNINRPGGQ